MELSVVRSALANAYGDNLIEVTDPTRNQTFGYAGSDKVIICGLDYSIKMDGQPKPEESQSALDLFNMFVKANYIQQNRYRNRKQQCINFHTELLKLGYKLTNCVWHTQASGDTVRAEYVSTGGDGWMYSELFVAYSPTTFVVSELFAVPGDVVYTPGYEESQLTFLGISERVGMTKIKTIEIAQVEHGAYKGDKHRFPQLTSLIPGCMHVDYITSTTTTNQIGHLRHQCTGALLTGEMVEITINLYKKPE